MFLARQEASPGSAVPAVPPWPDSSNVSLESRGGFQITVVSTFTGFACAAVLARLYVRTFMLKKMAIDDYVLIVALVCSATVLACFIEEVKLGVGEHLGNPHVSMNIQKILHWSYFHAWLIVVGISSVKISVGFFLLRLVQGKWYKRFIIAWIAFLVVFTLACVGSLLFQCLPVNGAWNFTVKFAPKTKCYSNDTYRSVGLFNGAINIFTDFVFASLPIPIIWSLQINMRTKISLVCILSLGYFACGAAIVKEILLANFFKDKDSLYENSFQIWNVIEINTGILAACLPALRPIFAFLLETANGLRSSSARRRVPNSSGSGVRGRYYIQEDSMKLGSLPSRSTAYGVSVVSGPRPRSEDKDFERTLYSQSSITSSGPMSKLEASIGENDTGSEENILAIRRQIAAHMPRERPLYERERDRNRGIMRTTEVVVSR